MPTYIYKCANCDKEIELYRSFDAPPIDWMNYTCPYCNKNTLKKEYQPISVHFKGDGFYKTDNATTKQK